VLLLAGVLLLLLLLGDILPDVRLKIIWDGRQEGRGTSFNKSCGGAPRS